MSRERGVRWAIVLGAIAGFAGGVPGRGAEPAGGDLNLVPWPKALERASGGLAIGAKSRIVFADASLEPLARVVSDEIFLTAGVRLETVGGQAAAGDLGLRLDPQLQGEAYALEVTDRAVVGGGSYNAVALGTVTLEQALQRDGAALSLPRLKVSDRPDYRMRAIQMCIKHQPHQISMIKQGVDLCRQYKLNTLALHASNYQMLWLFYPAFRENPLPKGGSDGGAAYSLEEMKDLVDYARRRGVAIMPATDTAHSLFPGAQMQWLFKAMPERLGPYEAHDPKRQTLLDSKAYWEAMDDLAQNLARTFDTAEYLHVGAIDGETAHFGSTEPEKKFIQQHQLRNSNDVWAWILVQLHAINKKHGKETMAYEGVNRSAAAHVQLPKEVAFFAYQTWYYPSDQMIADGYRVLNAAWRPLYTCGGYPAREIYAWSPNILRHNGDPNIDIHLPKSELLLGPLLSTWEGCEIGHMEILTDRGAAMAERCWNEGAGRTWEDFSRRLKPAMARLAAIQVPLSVALDGLIEDTTFLPVDRRWESGTVCYADKLTITLKPACPDAKVYYTATDPYFIWTPERPGPANPKSKLYEGPLTFTNRAPGVFRAQCFDAAGKPAGGEYCKIFSHQPILVQVEGADERFDALGRVQPRVFSRKAVVKFSTPAGEKLRYRTTPPNAQPTAPDQEYPGPITITRTTTFWVGKGTEGYPLTTTVRDDGFKQNLLTMDRVKITSDAKEHNHNMDVVCDGFADKPDNHWNGRGEAALTIELAMPRTMNELQIFNWWGDGRAYRYTVEVSEDGQGWKQVVDWSKNARPAGPEGYRHAFDPRKVRFIRIHMRGNTTNNHGHLSEVCAYDTTEAK